MSEGAVLEVSGPASAENGPECEEVGVVAGAGGSGGITPTATGSYPGPGRLPSEDEADLACRGVHMLLNNGMGEATELFRKYKHESPLMSFGDSFVTFLVGIPRQLWLLAVGENIVMEEQGLMTFEEEKMSEAKKALEETEKRCEIHNGFFHSVRNKFSSKKTETTAEKKRGNKSNGTGEINHEKPVFTLEERLQRTIIVADCLHFEAFLTFLNQDVPSFIKGGWMLRKAWKIYDKTYKEIKGLYEGTHWVDKRDHKVHHTRHSNSFQNLRRQSHTTDEDVIDFTDHSMSQETIERLLGSVCFGYGLLLLCLSCVPPKILKFIEFLGFEGDRDAGVKALEFSSKSKDMKAPLATLSLLWYHTILRSFFSLDGGNILAGVEESSALLQQSEAQYPDAALFLFFRARIQRLKCEVEEALMTYKMAHDAAADQREIQLICVYEIGWGCLMKLNWKETLECFHRLKEESRWSKSFYAYLTAICHGALGDLTTAYDIFKEVPGLVKRKNNQIEDFVTRKSERLKKRPPTQDQIIILGLEVLYLWNALPTCTPEYLEAMLVECSNLKERSYFYLKSLIEGGIYKQLGKVDIAKQCLEDAVKLHSGIKEDGHVTPFAYFELGTLWASNQETAHKGKEYLVRAKDKYSNYDFENRLHTRIYATIKQMKRDGIFR